MNLKRRSFLAALFGLPFGLWMRHRMKSETEPQIEVAEQEPVIEEIDEAQVEPDDLDLAKDEESIKDQLQAEPEFKLPEKDYDDDVFLTAEEKLIHASVLGKLAKIQKHIGFGNFNLVGFDRALRIAADKSHIGAFSKPELDFMEQIFFRDASEYGFLGDKVLREMTHVIHQSKAVKVPYTGHYLLKGESHLFYEKVRKDVGGDIILTSGIRSPMKQMYLFLAKANRVGGNLSRASRSLAPPGYSFHGSGDFDVGKRGLGARNFTEAFADTDEFKRLIDLGYVSIRYFSGNKLGVRYEPWHVKLG